MWYNVDIISMKVFQSARSRASCKTATACLWPPSEPGLPVSSCFLPRNEEVASIAQFSKLKSVDKTDYDHVNSSGRWKGWHSMVTSSRLGVQEHMRGTIKLATVYHQTHSTCPWLQWCHCLVYVVNQVGWFGIWVVRYCWLQPCLSEEKKTARLSETWLWP